LIITLSYELRFEFSYTLWKSCEIIYEFVNSEIVQKNQYQGVICIGTESVCDPEIVEQSVFRGPYLWLPYFKIGVPYTELEEKK
jgi:hypothetical protein